ncbi:contact-dependent growth inhibition system immunity protein [Streptomyces sp. ODS28]|uniref:contact-dependent growth inhibition system immunity protein n=1 Tax=Streptomyces sp. ODS28 TaxID=3136688 RepID=UPI0031EA3386
MESVNDRFSELRDILRSYASAGYAFDDTRDIPGLGLRAYMRQVAHEPSRAQEAINQIDDLLSAGLFDESIADDVATLPHINPPEGVSVEACLGLVRTHLENFAESGGAPDETPPETVWEWRRRFPELSHLLSAYFHQDFSVEYSSRREALDDYISGVSAQVRHEFVHEVHELMELVGTEQELEAAAFSLGLGVYPPKGVSMRQWFIDMAQIVSHKQQQ